MLQAFKQLFRRPPAAPVRAERPREVRFVGGNAHASFDTAATNDENRKHWRYADGLSAERCNSAQVRRILRNRGRYETDNNSYLSGMMRTLSNDCIGRGPRLQLNTKDVVGNQRVERAFAHWAKQVRLAEKLRIMRRGRAVDGEAFLQLVTNPRLASAIKLDLRLIAPERVTSTDLSVTDSQRIDGIRFDESGNPVAYDLLDRPVGRELGINDWKSRPVDASQIVHWFRCERAEQYRGIPEIVPALHLFAQLRRFTLAVIAAAEAAADHAGVIKANVPPEDVEKYDSGDVVELEPRSFVTLPAGWDINQIDAKQPTTTYDSFVSKILNEAARCVNMPYNVAAGNSASYNYASGRLDHQVYYKSQTVDRDDLAIVCLDRVFLAWLDEAAMIPGLLPEDGPFAAWQWQWFWDGNEHVDPAKEANAAEILLRNNLLTLAHYYAAQGQDWRDAIMQRAEEIKLCEEQGVPWNQVVSKSPDDEEEETDEESEKPADSKKKEPANA